jgi:hypothetical protein
MARPRNFALTTVWLVLPLVVAAPAAAQGDLSGVWGMDTTAQMAEADGACVFEGICTMDQDGNELTGRVELELLSGPPECPPVMGADLAGGVQGNEVVMGAVMDAGFGEASFTGERTSSFAGGFTVTSGPFAGTTGTWLAERQSVTEVPAADARGLVLLALALAASAAFLLVRRRRAA